MRRLIEKERIVFLTTVFRVGYGVGLVIRKQAEFLLQAGIGEVNIITADPGIVDGLEEVMRVHKITLNPESFEEVMQKLKPTIAIAHTPPFFSFLANYHKNQLYKIAYDHGEPFPEFFPEEEKARNQVNLNKYSAIANLHKHISISQFIERHAGVSNSTVLYNGVDHLPKSDIDMDNRNLREVLSIPENTPVVASLTRIGEGESFYKGYDLLIRLKEQLEAKCTEIPVFVLMGRAIPKGNQAEVRFEEAGFRVLENVSESDKQLVLTQCDLFISSSLWEGFNLPLTEAQYVGAPVAAFSVGAHPEVTPFHFATFDELFGFALQVLKNEDFKAYVAWEGKKYVNQFTWKRNVEGFLSILANIDLQKDQVLLAPSQLKEEYYRQAIERDLKRRGSAGNVEKNPLYSGSVYPRYNLKQPAPLVSIIIPNHNHFSDLQTCVESIFKKSTYSNFEILVAENGSTDQDILEYYENLKTLDKVKIINWDKPFNYAAVNNFAARAADGEFLLFLNNDTEVISSDWIERLMEYAQQKEVGAVGAKLLFPDRTIQHGGIIIGINGVAANMYAGMDENEPGYRNRLRYIQNLSAVTAACLMVRKEVFEEVQGFDEKFVIALNDVDLCLKIQAAGFRNVWTPFAQLFHYEMKTRGEDLKGEKAKRFQKEIQWFQKKWSELLGKGDPYYHPYFSTEDNTFELSI